MVFLLDILYSSELKNWNDIAKSKKLLLVGSSLFLQIIFQSMWQVIQFIRYRCFRLLLSLSGLKLAKTLAKEKKEASLGQKKSEKLNYIGQDGVIF